MKVTGIKASVADRASGPTSSRSAPRALVPLLATDSGLLVAAIVDQQLDRPKDAEHQ
jgi:hypothetical protein